MKKAILILTLFISSLSSFADYRADITTPNGSIVAAWIMDDMSISSKAYSDSYWSSVYPNAQMLPTFDGYSSTYRFNCHGYAWHMSELSNPLSSARWIGRDNAIDEDIYWTDGSYIEVSAPTYPAKVTWPESINHSAITTDQPGWFISKWGAVPLMRHKWDDTPYAPYSSSDLKYYVRNIPSQSIVSGGIYSVVSALDSTYEIGAHELTFSRLTAKGPIQLQRNDTAYGFYYGWQFNGSGENYTIKFYNQNYGLSPLGSSGLQLSYNSTTTWKVKPSGDGYFYIEEAVSGQRFTIPGSGATTGTDVQLATPASGLNQKWKLVPILRVDDPYARETMTIASYGYSGDVVFTNQTTSEQTTVSNILPGTFKTIYLKTTNPYTITFTNGSGVTQAYASLDNPHGRRNWAWNSSTYTTDNSNIWTYGGPYVLRISTFGEPPWDE
jgi:hypothetical protein